MAAYLRQYLAINPALRPVPDVIAGLEAMRSQGEKHRLNLLERIVV
jgi:hypothetical protein